MVKTNLIQKAVQQYDHTVVGSFVTSFPGLRRFWMHKEHRGPGIFSHAYDVKGSKVVERTRVHWGSE